jgi:hypothetical protein
MRESGDSFPTPEASPVYEEEEYAAAELREIS